MLDTNVVVSALLFREGRPPWVREGWLQGRFVPLASRQTVRELMRVLAVPKFQLTEDEAEALLAEYVARVETVEMPAAASRDPSLPDPSDPDDRMFVELASAAKADFLVTGDAELRRLPTFSGVRIVTPAAFRELVETES